MEHFTDYRGVLTEIDRVMTDKGIFWIAVPNGFSFDDSSTGLSTRAAAT
jgi:hypothetical protein